MNRKQRRAQEAKISSAEEIPLARPPDGTQRKAKTLYELAAERQAELGTKHVSGEEFLSQQNVVNVAIGPNGEIKTLDGSKMPISTQQGSLTTEEDMSPWLDTLLLAVSLSAVHFTFEALVLHQYADELNWVHVFWHTALKAFPLLTLLIHFMHGHLVSLKLSKQVADAVGGLKQILFVAVANVAGCYLIHLTNMEGYMAVMKNAPSIGTLWVWSVIELGLVGAVIAVAGPGFYAWYHGYAIY